jgi:hypothetical protein
MVITLLGLQGLSDSETVDAVTFDLRRKPPVGCRSPATVGWLGGAD